MDPAPVNSSREEFYKPGTAPLPVKHLSDDQLERQLADLVAAESEATADVVAHIAEFERRRLFAPKSFPGMFDYCTKKLGYSEGAAYLRIYAGRLSLEYPELIDLLRARRLHLTAIRTVGPHLKASNRVEILSRCLCKTEHELKFFVAELAPKPEPSEVVRRLPSPEPLLSAPTAERAPALMARELIPRESPKARIEPLTPQRVRFAFTGSEAFLIKVDRARELLRHKYPAGALEDIFFETVEFFLISRAPDRAKRRLPPRFAKPHGRRIPNWVKETVYTRDGGRCTFRSPEGTRCEARGGLEYDHVVPWAHGGVSNDPKNVRLLCRTHNVLEAERIFGPRTTP